MIDKIKYIIAKAAPPFIAIGLIYILLGIFAPSIFGINLETGTDQGILKACGSSDWGDFEGDYPLIWAKTDNGHFVYWFEYAPYFNKTLKQGSFYSFEYGYEYMPSGCSAGKGIWVKSLSRVRDEGGHIVWGDWWLW